jgi:hypothetical protein
VIDRELVAKFAELLALLRDLHDVRAPTTRLLAHCDVSLGVFLPGGLTDALVQLLISAGSSSHDPGPAAYHHLNRARELKSLRKRAKLLGFDPLILPVANSS